MKRQFTNNLSQRTLKSSDKLWEAFQYYQIAMKTNETQYILLPVRHL
jgi:hypothetical protein